MSHLCKCGHSKDDHHFDNCHCQGCYHREEDKSIICPCNSFSQATPLELRWCEHIKMNSNNKWWFLISQNDVSHLREVPCTWNNCPGCGTPRPKPVKESLEEKFIEYLVNKPKNSNYEWDSKELTNIATEHFTKKEQ